MAVKVIFGVKVLLFLTIGNSTQSPCGHQEWVGDSWCDDANNNIDCNWDGGGCCNKNFADWDLYCQVRTTGYLIAKIEK